MISKNMDLAVFPAVAFVGFVGNAVSGVIMVKSGLKKPSNILLLGLAMGDFLFLFRVIDVPRLITQSSRVTFTWVMDLDLTAVCYRLLLVFSFLGGVGSGVSTTITVFITMERVLAVYYPLHFSNVLTTFRAKVIVIASSLISLPYPAIKSTRYKLTTAFYPKFNQWVGVINEKRINEAEDFYHTVITYYIIPLVPTTMVTLGCVLIGFKVKATLRRRKSMTSNTRKLGSTSRTRTLFAVSVLFSVTNVSQLLQFIPFLSQSSCPPAWKFVAGLYALFVKLLLLANSSGNFFIYVVFYPKFRKLIVQILCTVNSKK